jgi:hypothetical protein
VAKYLISGLKLVLTRHRTTAHPGVTEAQLTDAQKRDASRFSIPTPRNHHLAFPAKFSRNKLDLIASNIGVYIFLAELLNYPTPMAFQGRSPEPPMREHSNHLVLTIKGKHGQLLLEY